MTAIISTNYSDIYLWNLPLVVWGWHNLGVDVKCFMPTSNRDDDVYEKTRLREKLNLVSEVIIERTGTKRVTFCRFECPEHKESTYCQVIRNYAAAMEIDDEEYLVVSDCDMFLFQQPKYYEDDKFSVFGHDLVPKGQYPQCYITAKAKRWRDAFNLNGKTPQQAVDELLGDDECQDYRACRWSVDQEQSFLNIRPTEPHLINRAKEGTQFATHRYDRDDSFILDRLSLDTIDYHLNRPGYEPQNFDIILRIMKWHFPNENFDWLINYNEQYKQLL